MSVTEGFMQNEFDRPSLLKRLGLYDWLWALLVVIGGGVAYSNYSSLMDGFEVGILFADTKTMQAGSGTLRLLPRGESLPVAASTSKTATPLEA